MSDVYLTPAQACGRLDITRPTLAKRIRNGEIEAIKLGEARNSPVRVLIASIEAYEERHQMTRAESAA
ncbi:helix-turn-helix domain-containing protein [Nonomuraea sp. B12E4]|uniref:helix-turn-helix domain-containing protein n=1 Tax=Nonomuraea sp. B12E4 TaxID=3153564 RepID=UPI00325DE142